MSTKLRLDKYLADLGMGTRSQLKQRIRKGEVRINGQVVKKPEEKVDTKNDQVEVGGRLLSYCQYRYYLLHKPAGYVSATEDEKEETVLSLLPKELQKGLFPVGRLDKDTEGLLLLTNDGAAAHRLLSPKKKVDKTYYAQIDGPVGKEDQQAFQTGVDIGDEKPTLPARLEILHSGEESEILLTIQEGRFHQVKRMFAARGRKVLYLKRMSMGPLKLDDTLKKGEYRELTEEEKCWII